MVCELDQQTILSQLHPQWVPHTLKQNFVNNDISFTEIVIIFVKKYARVYQYIFVFIHLRTIIWR